MASVVATTALNPVVTIPLYLLFTRAPDRIREPVLLYLRKNLSSANISRTISTLKWLSAIGLSGWVSRYLSLLAQNNFRFRSEKHKYDWPNEVAVVTGAAGGFGSLISKKLAAKGVNVIAVDICDGLPADMKHNSKIHYYKCDITDREAVMNLARTVSEDHRDPSILINNAGVAYEHAILDASEKAIRKLFDVNIISHYFMCQAFMPAMIKNKQGHVVSIASMASFLSPPGLVPYCNTKAAVLSLHDGLQAEMRVYHNAPEIKFTCVHPTFAATKLAEPFMASLKSSRTFVLDPEVVADAVVKQILSGTGKQIVLAGGMEFISGIRGWPHWLQRSLIGLNEGKVELAKLGSETTSG